MKEEIIRLLDSASERQQRLILRFILSLLR